MANSADCRLEVQCMQSAFVWHFALERAPLSPERLSRRRDQLAREGERAAVRDERNKNRPLFGMEPVNGRAEVQMTVVIRSQVGASAVRPRVN